MPILRGPAYKPGDMKLHAGVPATIPAGWGVADWRIANQADFPGLARAIGQAWRDPGDVYDIAVQFRFPDGTRFLKGGSWVYTAPTPFPYPLAGTLADVKQWNGSIAALMALDVTQQIATYTVQAIPAGPYFYAGVCPAGGHATTQKLPLSTGKKALRWTFAHVGTGTNGVTRDAQLQTAAGDYIQVETQGGVTNVATSVGGVVGTYVSATPVATVDLCFDAGAGTFAVLLDGNPLALSNAAYTVADYVGIVQVHEQNNPSAHAGDTVTVGLDLLPTHQAAWGPGVTDVAGNPIGDGVTSDVGTRPGSATSGGHALTAAELPGTFPTEGLRSPADYARALFENTGAAAPHTHTIAPEQSTVLVLVKL